MKGKLICGSVLGASATLLERCDNVADTFPLFCRSDAGQGLGRPIIRVALFRLPPGDCRDRYSDRGRERCLCHPLIFAERFNQFRCPLHSTAGYLYRVHSFKDIIQHYARMKCTRTMAAKYMGVERVTLRAWIKRFNLDGEFSPRDRMLPEIQRGTLKAIVAEGLPKSIPKATSGPQSGPAEPPPKRASWVSPGQ